MARYAPRLAKMTTTGARVGYLGFPGRRGREIQPGGVKLSNLDRALVGAHMPVNIEDRSQAPTIKTHDCEVVFCQSGGQFLGLAGLGELADPAADGSYFLDRANPNTRPSFLG